MVSGTLMSSSTTVTNTSVNPARSIGPALFAGSAALKQLPLFIVAPLVGAAIGAVLWKALLEDPADVA